MNRIALLILFGAITILMLPQRARASAETPLEWSSLPPIPDAEGVAGPFAGVSGGALLVAGGANFPAGKPWEGGKKVWYDAVHVLERDAKQWRGGFRLPRPLGYGVSITTDGGVLCIGGDDAAQMHGDVFLMAWDGAAVSFKEMPALPMPVSSATGVLAGSTVYVMGGVDRPGATEALHVFLALDLANVAGGWKALDPWPGPPRMLATAGTHGGDLYLFGGASLAAGADGKPVRTYLTDAYRFAPGKGWSKLANLPHPVVAAPSPAPCIDGSLLLLGGDDGSKVGFQPLAEHPGFPPAILAYDVAAAAWKQTPSAMPFCAVTVPTVRWRGGVVVASGEIRPGVRSPAVWLGTPSIDPSCSIQEEKTFDQPTMPDRTPAAASGKAH